MFPISFKTESIIITKGYVGPIMTLKVYVVDNGGQWTHREWRVLRYLDVETKIIPNTTPFEEIDVDGLVLSGGAACVETESMKLGRTGDYLDKATYPIYGICLGMQFMAMYLGGKTAPGKLPEFGKVECIIDEHDDILKGLPDKFIAWTSHNDEVSVVPEGFEVLAHSENCVCQAFRHETRPLYGTQFHPEVEQTEHGYDIFKNFLEVCKR
jgi:GMP synthase (glutamine-hydrolysing)